MFLKEFLFSLLKNTRSCFPSWMQIPVILMAEEKQHFISLYSFQLNHVLLACRDKETIFFSDVHFLKDLL